MMKEGRRVVRVDSVRTMVTLAKRSGQLLPMELRVEDVEALDDGRVALIKVSQLNRGSR